MILTVNVDFLIIQSEFWNSNLKWLCTSEHRIHIYNLNLKNFTPQKLVGRLLLALRDCMWWEMTLAAPAWSSDCFAWHAFAQLWTPGSVWGWMTLISSHKYLRCVCIIIVVHDRHWLTIRAMGWGWGWGGGLYTVFGEVFCHGWLYPLSKLGSTRLYAWHT